MADVKWIKITTDMFDNRKIKHLRRLPDGDSIVLIWVMLLTMAGRCNAGGMIFLTENIPYTPKMLADELDFEESTVQLAIEALDRLGMVQSDKNGFLAIAGWEEHQNLEAMEKIRESKRLAQARWRAKQKALPETVETTVDSTRHLVDDADKDKEEDIDKELDKDKEKDTLSKDKEKRKKPKKAFSDDEELNNTILAFIEFRKGLKKPMTDYAVELLLKKLDEMADSVPEKIAILNQSMLKGWQDIYPLKAEAKRSIANKKERKTYTPEEEAAMIKQLQDILKDI